MMCEAISGCNVVNAGKGANRRLDRINGCERVVTENETGLRLRSLKNNLLLYTTKYCTFDANIQLCVLMSS